LKTVRLSKWVGVGTLISTILSKYSQWDRYTKKFEMIAFRYKTLKAILQVTDDEALIRKAREMAQVTRTQTYCYLD
jgi:hypothetical protein